ncbi:PREDICTED: uncharacterized protein LOC105970215 [Erythranthe guttata]|nr:PREDICTED: uncharacterized protein LOC105970215 [Erythranthe guttata]|eukprot:XP_012850479.1 PREDICTED: uncharacterized protein LOC105970215 [Erythranthe guttata]
MLDDEANNIVVLQSNWALLWFVKTSNNLLRCRHKQQLQLMFIPRCWLNCQRERQQHVKPDSDVDIYTKAFPSEEDKANVVTYGVLKHSRSIWYHCGLYSFQLSDDSTYKSSRKKQLCSVS